MSGIWHPVRRLIVERAAESPATLPELAEAAHVHLNTARVHVAALEEAGALQAEVAPPSGRGRPPLRYRLADDFTLPTTDFRGLAELLAAAVARSDQSPEELHRLGEDWGRYLAGRPGAQELERVLPAALERLGFDAQLDGRELVLSACPCPLVSPDRPQLVCELAIAVVEGVLAGSGSNLRVGGTAHYPARRRCVASLVA
ncbi:MAG TPA: helix-turn-helix domain-containing protein [Thermoleophilaceae bacterium]|jgi:predicted ArsR family transcriptional regulator